MSTSEPLVLASPDEAQGYKAEAEKAIARMGDLFSSARGVARAAVAEYLANQDGKTISGRRKNPRDS
jgi:hypothetical protein